MRKAIRPRRERGAALPFITVLLVLLLGMSAFAVDLGWIYLNASRVQRAADSAALAGVVYLPGDLAGVDTQVFNGSQANGYDVGTVNGNPTGGGGPDTLTWQAHSDTSLGVTLESSIETFFLKVLGFDSIDISRTATAEYIKPVPLGSPANCIGIGQSVGITGLPPGAGAALALCNTFPQNFWAAMNGRATALEHGDPYGVECGYSCSGTNPEWPATGQNYYYHAIEVPAGTAWVDVFLYDAAFYDTTGFAGAGDEDDLTFSSPGGVHMSYALFRPDSTPLIPSDNGNPVACTVGASTLSVASEVPGYQNLWARMCRIDTSGSPGIYILRTANSGSGIGGSNNYSILLDSDTLTAASFPRVYAVNSMSIFTNAPSGQATVYLAEVEPVHAGKNLEITFFDPGEGAGEASMTILPPPGVGGVSCSWTATDLVPGGGPTSGSSCTINSTVAGVGQYDGEWITMEVEIPDSYACGPDCFWKMDLDLNVSHDRTTWEARVIGNPVRLVPNP